MDSICTLHGMPLLWVLKRTGSEFGSMVPIKFHSATLLLVIDLIGTFVFAVEGASAAIQGNLDVLGLMVLAFATALGGGIIRDVLIGAVPPASLKDWRYAATAFAGAAMVFFLHRPVERHMDGE